MLKKGSRLLILEDAPFSRKEGKVLVFGIVARDGIIEGLISFRVERDGEDATEMIIKNVRRSRFGEQVKVLVTNGITVAGLNLIDIQRIAKALNVRVLAITRKKPHPSLLKRAVKMRGKNVREKVALIDRINDSVEIRRMSGHYVQVLNLDNLEVKEILGEALGKLRLAHIIASGITKGESRGRL